MDSAGAATKIIAIDPLSTVSFFLVFLSKVGNLIAVVLLLPAELGCTRICKPSSISLESVVRCCAAKATNRALRSRLLAPDAGGSVQRPRGRFGLILGEF